LRYASAPPPEEKPRRTNPMISSCPMPDWRLVEDMKTLLGCERHNTC